MKYPAIMSIALELLSLEADFFDGPQELQQVYPLFTETVKVVKLQS